MLEMLLLKMIQPAAGVNAGPVAFAASGNTTKVETGARPDEASKKKPQPVLSHHEATPVDIAETGVSVIPQIAPAPSGAAAPRPQSRASLFDMISSAQKVPVLQAREASLPRNTNVADPQAALEKIQQNWRRVIEQVTAQRISLGAFLELGLPTSLTDGTLEICFEQGSSFQINSVNNQKTFIQEVITAETGYRVRLICRKDESNLLRDVRAHMQQLAVTNAASPRTSSEANVAAAAASEAATNEPAPPNGAAKHANGEAQGKPAVAAPAPLNEIYQAYPAIKKLVEALDGELI
jgi:hypothetical protein